MGCVFVSRTLLCLKELWQSIVLKERTGARKAKALFKRVHFSQFRVSWGRSACGNNSPFFFGPSTLLTRPAHRPTRVTRLLTQLIDLIEDVADLRVEHLHVPQTQAIADERHIMSA